MPKPTIEAILGKRKTQKTRRKGYYEYLVKWENKPIEDATWLSEKDIIKLGSRLEHIPTQET